MKKILCLGLILLMVTLLVPAKQSEAHGYYWGGFWPGFAIGGLLGWGLSPHYYYPRYYNYPPPAYYYPPPTYYYSAPSPGNPPLTNVTPPPPPMPESGGRLFIYPRQNQSEERQVLDREECHKWAVGQTGLDPGKPLSGSPDAQTIQKSGEYLRAISACLDAKGYTVR
jgi:hypothetical protein